MLLRGKAARSLPRDEPPRGDERRRGDRQKRQTEQQVGPDRTVSITEEVLERAPGKHERDTTNQREDGRCDSSHIPSYT